MLAAGRTLRAVVSSGSLGFATVDGLLPAGLAFPRARLSAVGALTPCSVSPSPVVRTRLSDLYLTSCLYGSGLAHSQDLNSGESESWPVRPDGTPYAWRFAYLFDRDLLRRSEKKQLGFTPGADRQTVARTCFSFCEGIIFCFCRLMKVTSCLFCLAFSVWPL